MCSELYNAVLESWRGTYAWWREHNPGAEKFPAERSQSHYDRLKMFTQVRSDHPEWERLSVKVGRGVLCRFDRAARSFYKRCAEGKKPGFPRYKPRHRWRTIEIPDASASMVIAPGSPKNQSAVWWRLQVKGVPRLRFRDKHHRLATALGIGAELKELRVVRTPLRTEIHAVVRHPPCDMPAREPANPVGIDLGLKHRLVISDGTRVPARRPDRTRIKGAQRKLSRAKEGSNTRRKKALSLAKAHRREKEQTTQADFRLAHHLVSTYDGIATEDLNIAGMLKSKMFSRQISDQRWASLVDMLEYKAWKAGIRHVRVDPRRTSTTCSVCGHCQAMPLSVRVFSCRRCGLEMDRDVNAARNVGVRGFGRGSGGTLPDSMRHTKSACKTPSASGRCSHSLRAARRNRTHRRTVSIVDSAAVNYSL